MYKIITTKQGNIVKYAFPSSTEITMTHKRIITPNLIIGDLGRNNAQLHEVAELPEGFEPNAFTYDGIEFTSLE